MRFKKLRIFVGIALIVFTLLLANVIAFGLIQEKLYILPVENTNKKDIPTKNSITVVNNNATKNTTTIQTVNKTSTPTETVKKTTSNATATTPSQPARTVKHTVRTRAS